MPSLLDLVAAIPDFDISSRRNPSDISIQRVTADSRSVMPGTLFVAVKGGRVDGHRFIANAVERGATAVLGTLAPATLAAQGISLPDDVAYVRVADSRRALAVCSAALYGFPSATLTTIGSAATKAQNGTKYGVTNQMRLSALVMASMCRR